MFDDGAWKDLLVLLQSLMAFLISVVTFNFALKCSVSLCTDL